MDDVFEPPPLRTKLEIAVRLLALAGLVVMYLAPCSDRGTESDLEPDIPYESSSRTD